MQQLLGSPERLDLCRTCVARAAARVGGGWFAQRTLREDIRCEWCDAPLAAAIFHLDPDAHRSG